MQLHISEDLGALSRAFAEWLIAYQEETLRKQDRFTIALSGGSTPKLLHELLAGDGYRERIAWDKWHIFWGDERFVPFEDDRNNAKMAFDTLLSKVPVDEAHIHVMQTEDMTPEASARAYESILRDYFDGRPTGLDLVILGMGDDGHTLSLFPGLPVVRETGSWVTSLWLEPQQMYRITLTRTAANHAARVAFLAAGGKKQAVLKEVLQGDYQPDLYPAQVIRPDPGELFWFVDKPAAAQL